MCTSNFFCPSLAATDVWAGNMQPFVDFGQRTVFKDYFFNHPLGTFFNFSFFCPQRKAEADSFICASFLVVCHLLVLMLRCDYICSFLCSAVFFAFPRIRHSGFGRLYQSSDALVGVIVGIRLTPSVVIIYVYFDNSFFSYYAMINNQSFFFGCQRGTISWSKNLSYLIAHYDVIFESIFGNKQ